MTSERPPQGTGWSSGGASEGIEARVGFSRGGAPAKRRPGEGEGTPRDQPEGSGAFNEDSTSEMGLGWATEGRESGQGTTVTGPFPISDREALPRKAPNDGKTGGAEVEGEEEFSRRKSPWPALTVALALSALDLVREKADTCPAGNRAGAGHIMAMCPHPKQARHLIGRWQEALICPDIRQRTQQIEETEAAGRLKVSERIPKTRLGDRSATDLAPPPRQNQGRRDGFAKHSKFLVCQWAPG